VRARGRSRKVKAAAEQSAAPPVLPKLVIDDTPPASTQLQAGATPAKIQKSELTISEPRRHRDKGHLKFVASQPCLVCGRRPADAHHLRFTQPRALGRKVSDEFTVLYAGAITGTIIASATRPPGGVDRPSIRSGLRGSSGFQRVVSNEGDGPARWCVARPRTVAMLTSFC
jgi:hypothetical protein